MRNYDNLLKDKNIYIHTHTYISLSREEKKRVNIVSFYMALKIYEKWDPENLYFR